MPPPLTPPLRTIYSSHTTRHTSQFLLDRGMSADQPGTAASYPGDGMMASELRGITPMELSEKLLFVHGRRGRKGKAVQAIRGHLRAAAERARLAAYREQLEAA